jgi:hypothetical protein
MVLEGKFKMYQTKPWTLDPLNPGLRVECTCELLSQVDTPLEKSRLSGEDVYLIRWLLVWTPESQVADPSEAWSSYEKYCVEAGRRFSSRIKKNAGVRLARWKNVMDVVQIP